MNAPALNRREFSKRPRRHPRCLLARSGDRTCPGAAAPARQPAGQSPPRCLDSHQCRRQRDGIHGQGRARPGHSHRARPDRGGGARSSARPHQDHLRRHRADPERRHDRRQPFGREQRYRVAHGRRRSAGDPARARRQAARRGRRRAHDRRRQHQGARRPAHRLRRACRSGGFPTRGNRQSDAQAIGEPPDRGKSIARFDIPGKVTGGVAFVQDLRLPGMLHGRVVRPPRYGSQARQRG